MKRILLASAFGLSLLPFNASAEIGSVAAVNRDMDGTPPAGSRRALALGNQVVSDELIQTSRIGSGQLIFLDQTTLTVAPSSDIVLDQYVYDPATQTGDIAITLTKGALRFIGGRISKKRDAIVRTPSATIGIRGGMTIIKVDENGRTEVFHMGGEYSTIASKSGKGPKVTLSRPSSSASVTPDQFPTFTGIVTAEQLAAIYGGFEGSGDGGSSTLSSLGSQGASGRSGGTPALSATGGSTSSGGTSTTAGTSSGDEEETSEGTTSSDGTNTSSGGTSVSSGDTSGSSGSNGGSPTTNAGTPISGGTGVNTGDGTSAEEPPAPTVTEIFEEGIGGLAEQNSGQEEGSEIQPVSTSGERPKDAEPEVELSGTFSDSPAAQDNPASEPTNPDEVIIGSAPPSPPPPDDPAPTFNLTGAAFSDPTGFIAFDNIFNGSLIGEGFPSGSNIRETVTIEIPESSADFLDRLPEGQLVNLFANEFTANAGLFAFGNGTNFPRGSTTSIGPVDGFGFSDLEQDFHFYIVNGDADPTSGSVEGGAILFGIPSLGQASVADVDVSNAVPTSNTIGTFIIDNAITELAQGFVSSEPFRLNIVGNAQEARFPNSTHSLTSTGGRAFGGELFIDNSSPSGDQFTSFFVAAGPLFQTGDSLRFSLEGFGTDSEQFVGDGLPEVFVRDEQFGTFEDADGNTVFGFDENYLIVSSILRDDPAAPLSLSSGTERRVGGGFNNILDPFAAVAVRDLGGDRLIQDPFELALGPETALTAAINAGLQVPASPLLSGFAVGHATCPSGLCGFSPNQTGQNNGFYRLGGDAFFSFENGNSSQIGQGLDINAITASLQLFGDESEEIQGQSSSEFIFAAVGSPTSETAYSDEKTFAAIGRSDTQGSIGSAGGLGINNGTFAIASTAVTGDGGLFSDTNTAQSEFLVWGPWSAVYETNRASGPEEDVVNLGFFVAGADPSQFPTTGIAQYEGFAVGTRGDLVTGSQIYVSGESSLVYNFGQNVGSFSINIAEFDIAAAAAAGLGAGVNGYTVFNTANGVDLNVQGRFFAGGTNPVAATGGDFGITDNVNNVVVTGVFGADSNGIPTLP